MCRLFVATISIAHTVAMSASYTKSLFRMQEVKSSTGIVKTWEFDRICICKIEDRKA
jgi:hypothetical protein